MPLEGEPGPAGESRRVICSACGARGRVQEIGPIFGGPTEWVVEWDVGEACPAATGGAHSVVPDPDPSAG